MAEADPSSSSQIFISYRRDDSAGHVLALLPALQKHFGTGRIFKDTESIPPGEDYHTFIMNALESCSVMPAVIGRDWLTVQDPDLKTRRLDNPDDPLRLEVTVRVCHSYHRPPYEKRSDHLSNGSGQITCQQQTVAGFGGWLRRCACHFLSSPVAGRTCGKIAGASN